MELIQSDLGFDHSRHFKQQPENVLWVIPPCIPMAYTKTTLDPIDGHKNQTGDKWQVMQQMSQT
jgi:hypothetical protein